MLIALYRFMNISTASMPDIKPDQFMAGRPASSSFNNSVEDSRFSRIVNDAEKSVTRPEDKKEAFSKKEDTTHSKPAPVKNHEDAKTGQAESRPEAKQETDNDKSDQQVSSDDINKDDSSTEGKVTEGKYEKDQDTEPKQSDLADSDINGDVEEDTDITDNDTGNDNAQVEGQVIAAFEQALSSETSIQNQAGDQVIAAVNNLTDANSSKSQSNVTGSTPINNEGNETSNNLVLEEVLFGELNAEDGEPDDAGVDNKASNKNAGFGSTELEEISEDIEIDEELKEKIKLAATRELPEKYAKKIVTDKSDNKTVQSHINAFDPDVLEELNDFKTLQDKMLSGNTQKLANTSGIKDTFKGVSDTALNSLESFNSNTTINSAEVAQNQAMTMASSKAALGQGNAARTAGFSELLNQVVYVAKGRNKLNVTVNHEEFGKLKINVSMDKGMLNIHINASDKVVREYLESNVQSIIESLSKDGVSVGGFSVALKDHQGNSEKRFLMDSGLNRQYENISVAAVHSNRGLVNVFA